MDPHMQKISNVTDALSALEQVGRLSTYSVKVPSSEAELVFKELNAKQQKELMQSIVDSPFYRTRFILTIYKILKENYMGEIDFNRLTILDKQIIILKTRIDCFSPVFEITTEANVEDKKVDLLALYEAAQVQVTPLSSTVTIDGVPITVESALPTIKTEFTLENELHKTIEITDINNPETLRQTLGNIFVGEISKYITGITINDSFIDFSPLKFKDRIAVLEKLPNKLTQKVVEYIDICKKQIDSITTVKLKEKDTEKVIEEKIDIDGSFLTIR